jgi:hypothetical protein
VVLRRLLLGRLWGRAMVRLLERAVVPRRRYVSGMVIGSALKCLELLLE